MAEELKQLFSQAEIAVTVRRLAEELDQDYQNLSPILVGVIKGSFIFLADLVRNIKEPIDSIEFIKLSSYDSATVSSVEAEIIMELSEETIKGKHIILVEDIVDTGITTNTALKYLENYHPASLKVCALLAKPSRRQIPVEIDYLGLTLPDVFVVGYGMDFAQKYRQLPNIYTLELAE